MATEWSERSWWLKLAVAQKRNGKASKDQNKHQHAYAKQVGSTNSGALLTVRAGQFFQNEVAHDEAGYPEPDHKPLFLNAGNPEQANEQKRDEGNIEPWILNGFVEGEAGFYVGLRDPERQKMKEQPAQSRS